MRHCFVARLRAYAVALSSAAIILMLQPAGAADPSWPDRPVTLKAQEQPLRDFLKDLFNAAGLRALPGSSVSGRISGRFSDSPEAIFNQVVKAYGLLPYYDGTVMHISTVAEMQSKSIKVQPAEIDRVVRTLASSDLADRYQSVQVLRSNGVIKVRGAPEFISDVEELIANQGRPKAARASVPAAENAALPHKLLFRSFPLKYASASDLTFFQNGREVRVPGVASLLRSMTGVEGSLIATSSEPESAPGYNLPSLRGKGLRRVNRDRDRDEDEEEGDDRSPRRGEPQAPSGFVSERPGLVKIEADPNLNAVLIRDYGDAMPLYQDMIAQLDKEPQLIEIQVTIVDIDRSKLTDLGVDWRYDDRRASVSAGGGDIDPPQNGGLLLNTVLGDSGKFLARVNALAKNGNAQIVSRPQVLTLSNLEAILTTDQSFFVRVAGNEDVDLFNVSVGTALRVVPHVVGEASDPQIRLRVGIEDGSLSPDQAVDNIPIVERSSLNTQAIIYDGQSLLLGGLVRDETTKDTTKVPVLGDVPGVGRLFKRTTDVNSRQERLFLISPRIVATNRTSGAGAVQPPNIAPVPEVQTAQGASPQREPQVATRRPQAYLDGF